LRLFYLLTQGDAQRSVNQLIRDTVATLYTIFLDSPPEAWRALPHSPPLSDKTLEHVIEELRTVPLGGKKSLENARAEDFQRVLNGDWAEFISKGIAGKIVAGEETFNRQTIEPQVKQVYKKLIAHATAMLLNRIASFTEGAYELLSHFHEEYERLKHRRRVMRFEDVTRIVGQVAERGGTDALAFRLDAHIDHLLLDEFQDTSPQQWAAIRPFAARVVDRRGSKSSTFFCVGDVKQAIYGWRGGVAEIFDGIAAQLNIREGDTSLAKSFRSSPIIIDTVNRVFTRLTRHGGLGRSAAAVAAFEKAFPPHDTEKRRYNGYACLRSAPADDEDQKGATLAFAAGEIERLVRQASNRTMGVLCRRHETIASLIYQLRQRGIQASEEGGNALTDSAAVNLIVSLLTLADHPGDTIARHHIATSSLAERIGLRHRRSDDDALRVSRYVRERLMADGYGPAIYEWTTWLAPECDQRELNRLNQLVEQAFAYQPAATLRTGDFLRVVRTERVADPTTDMVRVMTIHAAKGLEFDVVVLPDLDQPLVGQHDPVVTHRVNHIGPIDVVCKYVDQSLRPLLPTNIAVAFEEAETRRATEALCVLYVSLTRAIHALHMIVSPAHKGQRSEATGKLLQASLCDGDDAQKAPPNKILWEHGDPNWFLSPGDEKEQAAAALMIDESELPPLSVKVAAADGSGRRSLERVAPSRLHAAQSTTLADVFSLAENRFALDRGTLIHAAFESIHWLDDEGAKTTDRDQLQRLLAGLAPPSIQLAGVIDDFLRMLDVGDARRLLTQAQYALPKNFPFVANVSKQLAAQPLTFRVRREHPFALMTDGRLQQGSIDRLVLYYHGDQLVAADIVDFKTDADIAAAKEKHRDQLLAYRDAVSRSFALPPDHIAARLLMVKEGVIISCTE
jgi:ATP-dependent exoDNAse (exonuclease V) beta subunit